MNDRFFQKTNEQTKQFTIAIAVLTFVQVVYPTLLTPRKARIVTYCSIAGIFLFLLLMVCFSFFFRFLLAGSPRPIRGVEDRVWSGSR